MRILENCSSVTPKSDISRGEAAAAKGLSFGTT
jgi:hypothetical protein